MAAYVLQCLHWLNIDNKFHPNRLANRKLCNYFIKQTECYPAKVVTASVRSNRGLIKQTRGSSRVPRRHAFRETSPVIKPSITRYDEGVIFD